MSTDFNQKPVSRNDKKTATSICCLNSAHLLDKGNIISSFTNKIIRMIDTIEEE